VCVCVFVGVGVYACACVRVCDGSMSIASAVRVNVPVYQSICLILYVTRECLYVVRVNTYIYKKRIKKKPIRICRTCQYVCQLHLLPVCVCVCVCVCR